MTLDLYFYDEVRLIIVRLRPWAYNIFHMPNDHIKKGGHESLFFNSVYICQTTYYNRVLKIKKFLPYFLIFFKRLQNTRHSH
jgi:hypothetical protein